MNRESAYLYLHAVDGTCQVQRVFWNDSTRIKFGFNVVRFADPSMVSCDPTAILHWTGVWFLAESAEDELFRLGFLASPSIGEKIRCAPACMLVSQRKHRKPI